MTPEDAKKFKCDRCGVEARCDKSIPMEWFSLFRHTNGWRCPSCIWNERENLIEWAKSVLTTKSTVNDMVCVSRKNLHALEEVVEEVTRISK